MGKKKIYTFIACYLFLCCSFPCFSSSDLRNCVIRSASSQVGVTEATGKNDGVQVEAYLASVGLKKGNPYCGAFSYWNFKQCKVNMKLVNPAYAPNWFPESKIVMRNQTGWDKVQPADLFGLYFANKKRIAHVGIIEKIGLSYIITLEGNTSPQPSTGEADRNGDGVWRKKRMKKGIYQVSSWIK